MGMYENSYGFFREKMMWYFSSVVLFVSFPVILLRCGWGYVAWRWMLGGAIVGFGQERVGRNVLSVVVVSNLVCYRMFTVYGVLLFEFAMLV